mgnify:FL=1
MSTISFKANLEDHDTSIQPKLITQRRPSIMDMIKEKQSDQDFNQKLNVGLTLVLELYRVLMGAFLVAFVPQQCEYDICSLTENITRDDTLSQCAIVCNVITMVSFLGLYFVEVKRENKMINYLEVNRFNSVDNESVGEALEKLADSKKQSIWNYDRYYQKAGYASTIAFLLNAVLSSIVLYNHYLDSKTLTVYLTNLLFMGSKVSDVFSTVNTKKNVFYSAYLKNKVQFNDVDPDKIQAEEVDETNPSVSIEADSINDDAIVNATVDVGTATEETMLVSNNPEGIMSEVSLGSSFYNTPLVSTEGEEAGEECEEEEEECEEGEGECEEGEGECEEESEGKDNSV